MPDRARLKILVVEDDSIDREFLRRALKEARSVHEAATAVEAEKLFKEEDFDCVLLDYRIPDGGELDLLPKFVDKGVPVIVMTGLGSETTAVQAMKMGASDYLVKGSFDKGRLWHSVVQAYRQAELEEALKRRQKTVEQQRDLLEREVSERRQMEERLRASNEKLVGALEELEKAREEALKQERIATLGQMASGIAHDLNNALVPAVGLTDFLLFHCEIDPEHAEHLKDIRSSVLAAAAVVKRLRAFYANTSAKEETLNLNQVVKEALGLTRPRRQDEAWGFKTSEALTPEVFIKGVEGELRDVLVNLIINALDAMGEGGTLSVRTGRDGDSVWFEVEDEGCGMPEDILNRCTEAFFSTKGEHGTGLGLFLAQTTVSRFRGELQLNSSVDGTTIRGVFPAAQASEATPSSPEECEVKPLKILAVEDEEIVAEVLRKNLISEGHEVFLFKSGVQAVKYLESGFRPDLVITDRSMPQMSGDELAKIVKDRFQLPVLMITGYGDLMDAAGERPEAVDAVLSKPYNTLKLRDRLASLTSKSK